MPAINSPAPAVISQMTRIDWLTGLMRPPMTRAG